MYDRDGTYTTYKNATIVDAILDTWNYEGILYADEDCTDLLFDPLDMDNEELTDCLQAHGYHLEVVDGEKYRDLRNSDTGKIYKPSWQD
jgi:hypothetical protein